MITFKPYKTEHLRTIELQANQAHLLDYLAEGDLTCLETDTAITITSDGKNVFCGGCTTIWKDRAVMWCFFGSIESKDFIAIHNIIRRFAKTLNGNYKRLEMYVNCDFENGHRWAKALGFTVEAPRMRNFALDGNDQTMYSLIRE